MALSSYRREGTTEYNCKALECNWQEERSRLEVGETVKLELMKGAVVRPEEPDISIAPPTREPGMSSNGRLEMPHRMTRSRTTNDSSRQGADDGFREYTSMNQTFFLPPEQRKVCPISIEPYFHGTWGGPVQHDGRTKTRVGPFNRSKNQQLEQERLPDGEEKVAFKLISADTFNYALEPRVTGPRVTEPRMTGSFGEVLPRHPAGHAARMLTTTAMASWNKRSIS